MSPDPLDDERGYPVPPDEADRLTALHALRVLDTDAEERFDRITRLAKRAFDVPIALVSLVDADRQWFKSCLGLAERETPRGWSFCTHAILHEGPFVVPDAAADTRFADNPLVTGEPHIRFYAGHPLRSRGLSVGTLCVIDRAPRRFGAEEEATLADLAALAETELGTTDLALDLEAGRRALRELHALQDRTELVLRSAGEGICGVDREGRITFANPAAAAMFDTSTDELLGVVLHEAFHHSRPDGSPYPWHTCPTFRTLRDGVGGRVGNEAFWRRDGTWFPADYHSAPILEDGAVTGAVITFADISERRAVERMKDEFVSVVSHELRTPLTSIRGSLGLLAAGAFGELPEKGRRMLEIAASNTERLIRLINDMLDLERMESGRVVMEPVATDVASLMGAAFDSVHGVAQERGVTVRVEPLDVPVVADPDRIVQALTNLLGNAVKFSEPGGEVVLDAERRDDAVVLRVRDDGRGIPADQLESIFERFAQVDASDAREKGGTGLGLAITRSIVEQHGGRVWAESAAGEGATFHVELPVDVAGATPAPQPDASSDACVVLFVEDDAHLTEVLRGLAESHGIEVLAATNEEDALRLARERRPLLVVVDLVLRPGHGLHLIDRLIADPAAGDTRIAVFTAHDVAPGDEARLRRLGIPVLTKVGDRLDAIDRLLAETARS